MYSMMAFLNIDTDLIDLIYDKISLKKVVLYNFSLLRSGDSYLIL